MRLTLARLRGEDTEAVVAWHGDCLKISYNENGISHKEWRRLRRMIAAAQREPEQAETDWLVPALVQMLTGWDLFADESAKKPVPITEESLDALPPMFLLEILNAIWGAVSPPSPSSIDSASTSSAAALAENARSGT